MLNAVSYFVELNSTGYEKELFTGHFDELFLFQSFRRAPGIGLRL